MSVQLATGELNEAQTPTAPLPPTSAWKNHLAGRHHPEQATSAYALAVQVQAAASFQRLTCLAVAVAKEQSGTKGERGAGEQHLLDGGELLVGQPRPAARALLRSPDRDPWQTVRGPRVQQPWCSRRRCSTIENTAARKGHPMARSYEYRFVRLGESGGSAFFGVQDKARNAYQEVVHEYARGGWRLVQIFAPGVAAFGAAKYYELIFERERTEGTTAATRAGRQRAFSVSAPQPGSRPGDPPGRAMASPGGGSDSRP